MDLPENRLSRPFSRERDQSALLRFLIIVVRLGDARFVECFMIFVLRRDAKANRSSLGIDLCVFIVIVLETLADFRNWYTSWQDLYKIFET